MGRLGTDVMALACIIGGATVGGAATMAALEARAGDVRVEVEPAEACVMAVAPEVLVRFEKGELRVGPDRAPRIPSPSSCAKITHRMTVVRMGNGGGVRVEAARVQSEEARERAADARARAMEARARAEEARARAEAHRDRIEAVREQAEAHREGLERDRELRRSLEIELRKLERDLANIPPGGG